MSLMSLRLATALSFLGSLLFGLGFCALLPPFEGFDETAHYSYIQQLAETGTWPRMTDPLSAEVEDYIRIAPGPASLGEQGSYKGFFAASPDAIRAGAAAVHNSRDPLQGWRAGVRNNWEGQHPPLYYALLAPAYSLTKSWSVDAQLIFLRGISLLLAWTGLLIAVLSIWRRDKTPTDRAFIILAPIIWPGLIPMWFPEMARLGNDSLVLFLAALTMVMVHRVLSPNARPVDSVMLGVACGLGLLTKATFLTIVAALALLLAYRLWNARRDPVQMRRALRELVLFSVTPIAIAGWWYAQNLIGTGSVVANYDYFTLAQKGGLAKNLPGHFSWGDILRNVGVIGVTFIWSGTWSLIPTPLRTLIPILLLLVTVTFAWIGRVWRLKRVSTMEGIALLVLAFFIIGLFQANLANIAGNGIFAIPFWYLHSLVPILAPLLGYGLAEAAGWHSLRPIIIGLVVYPLVFLPFATGWLALWYAGCFDRPVGPVYFSTAIECGLGPSDLFRRLALIAAPELAIPLLLAGLSAMLVATIVIVRRAPLKQTRSQNTDVHGVCATSRNENI